MRGNNMNYNMKYNHNFIENTKFSNYDGFNSKWNTPSYSGLQNTAAELSNSETSIGNSLANFNIGGNIENDIYDIPGDANPDSMDFSEDGLNRLLDSINSDIDLTKQLMQEITNQIEQNRQIIAQNNQTIANNDAEIEANEATIEADKQVPEQIYVGTDEDGNPIYEHNPDYDRAQQEIAKLTARNAELSADNAELSEMNASLEADNIELENAYDSYNALAIKKDAFAAKVSNIIDTINETNQKLLNLYGAGGKIQLPDGTYIDVEDYVANIDKYTENVKNGFVLWLSDHRYTMEDFANSELAKEYGYETPQEALDAFVALIISESNKTVDEVLAITSSLLNRCELYENWYDGYGTSNPFDQLFHVNEDGTPQYEALIKDVYGNVDKDNPRYKRYIPSENPDGVEGVDKEIANRQNYSEQHIDKTGQYKPEELYNYEDLKGAVYDALFGGVRNNVYSSYHADWNDKTSIDSTYEYADYNHFFNNTDDSGEKNKSTNYLEQLKAPNTPSYQVHQLSTNETPNVESSQGKTIKRLKTEKETQEL